MFFLCSVRVVVLVPVWDFIVRRCFLLYADVVFLSGVSDFLIALLFAFVCICFLCVICVPT